VHLRRCGRALPGPAINRRATKHRDCRRDLSLMASKGWSKPFDEPIELEDGTTLRTLRDAIQYFGKTVPKSEREHPTVTTAADHLTRSAEQNYPMFFAHAATLQAIYRNEERVFNPDRKDAHWGKRKLKRDK
jgi:hypothetical protein